MCYCPQSATTISTLEVARLVTGGHITLATTVTEWISLAVDILGAHSLELSHTVAIEAYGLPEPFHRDPTDRILVATACTLDLVLVTADRRTLAYPHVRTQDALK